MARLSEDTFHLGVKALIKNNAGEILLFQVNTKQLKSAREAYWDLPGGRVQHGQTVIDTLKREVLEETGINSLTGVEHVGMVLSNIRIPIDDSTVGLILSIYECEVPSSAEIALSDEHVAYKWFEPTKAAALLEVKYPKDFCEIVAGL